MMFAKTVWQLASCVLSRVLYNYSHLSLVVPQIVARAKLEWYWGANVASESPVLRRKSVKVSQKIKIHASHE